MFDSLSSKLQNAFRNLRGLGKISEANVGDSLREVRQETQQLAERKNHDAEWSEQALALDARFHELLSRMGFTAVAR